MSTHAVYLLANARPTLYVGVTSDLEQRLLSHRSHAFRNSFPSKCRVHKLVHVEFFTDIVEAIRREKQIKAMGRERKLDLIRERNPTLRDLMPTVASMLPPRRVAPPAWEERRSRRRW
jgi:putative endonuclease